MVKRTKGVSAPPAPSTPAKPPATLEGIVDFEDGENRAVRMFLAYYGGTTGVAIGRMKAHLRTAGLPYWPEWVEAAHEGTHLTKFAAQQWIRYLFSLEPNPEHIKQEWSDEQDGHHRLVNTKTGSCTSWAPYIAWVYLDGFIGHTAYYGIRENIVTAEQFCSENAYGKVTLT